MRETNPAASTASGESPNSVIHTSQPRTSPAEIVSPKNPMHD